jgi:hypothetical protein
MRRVYDNNNNNKNNNNTLHLAQTVETEQPQHIIH